MRGLKVQRAGRGKIIVTGHSLPDLPPTNRDGWGKVPRGIHRAALERFDGEEAGLTGLFEVLYFAALDHYGAADVKADALMRALGWRHKTLMRRVEALRKLDELVYDETRRGQITVCVFRAVQDSCVADAHLADFCRFWDKRPQASRCLEAVSGILAPEVEVEKEKEVEVEVEVDARAREGAGTVASLPPRSPAPPPPPPPASRRRGPDVSGWSRDFRGAWEAHVQALGVHISNPTVGAAKVVELQRMLDEHGGDVVRDVLLHAASEVARRLRTGDERAGLHPGALGVVFRADKPQAFDARLDAWQRDQGRKRVSARDPVAPAELDGEPLTDEDQRVWMRAGDDPEGAVRRARVEAAEMADLFGGIGLAVHTQIKAPPVEETDGISAEEPTERMGEADDEHERRAARDLESCDHAAPEWSNTTQTCSGKQ